MITLFGIKKDYFPIIVMLSFFFYMYSTSELSAQEVSPSLILTDSLSIDQEDMCIWISDDHSKSTVIASDNQGGKIFVYDLNGNTIQRIDVPGEPGSIDVRYNFVLGGQLVDIVGVCDKLNNQILFYKVEKKSGWLSFAGQLDTGIWPTNIYGFCLYQSHNDWKFYAFASGRSSLIKQWELKDNGDGTITGIEKRSWQNGEKDKTEGLVADDETGYLYAANEGMGVMKYKAEPINPKPNGSLVAATGEHGLVADVEGITLYYMANGEGYLLVANQGGDNFLVYNRRPPHDFVKTFSIIGVSKPDGIDVSNVKMNTKFPYGIFCVQNNNSNPKEITLCSYEDLGLETDTKYWDPSTRLNPAGFISEKKVPENFLFQNYPNPFNPSTNIKFNIPVYRSGDTETSLIIYDVLGKIVKVLHRGKLAMGTYEIKWDGIMQNEQFAPGGIYFAVLKVGNITQTIKLILMK